LPIQMVAKFSQTTLNVSTLAFMAQETQ
jgi:hypothetical protein